jgi:dTDP-4-amino-4,6-dideoxygalactose transaminase
VIKPFEQPINVTQPYLPPIQDYCEGLKEIWDSKWLTNNGPVLQNFTKDLENYFTTDNICLFNNGTLALQLALQGMGITGEVITSPYTFVATTHALYWNKIRPVFVDIEPNFYTLDPEKVEAAITPWTTAILAVHVYGYPCNLNALSDIARRHNLKLIYDAAHAFGVSVANEPIAHYGDLSMFSFHSTKVFHSIEGGMLVFKDAGLKSTFDYLKNFGFKNELEVVMPGTNAKMNEMQALMGREVLKHFPTIVDKRARIYETYKKCLTPISGITLPPSLPKNVTHNYAYMPIEVDELEFGISRDKLYESLQNWNIYARRYFSPLVSDYACYQNITLGAPLTVAQKVSSRILTLPIFPDLDLESVKTICEIIKLIKEGCTTP